MLGGGKLRFLVTSNIYSLWVWDCPVFHVIQYLLYSRQDPLNIRALLSLHLLMMIDKCLQAVLEWLTTHCKLEDIVAFAIPR